jgi:hypothetical protein
MSYTIGIIREFKTQHFHVKVDAIEETDLDLSWDDDGYSKRGLENGSLIAFVARARVYFQGLEVASDYLGGCIYKSLDDFADHKECAKENRDRLRREGKFQIYRKVRPYEHCLSKSDKLKARGFATRERAEQWAKKHATEAYDIFEIGKCGSYFSDMVANVCQEARKTVASMKAIHIREVKA